MGWWEILFFEWENEFVGSVWEEVVVLGWYEVGLCEIMNLVRECYVMVEVVWVL